MGERFVITGAAGFVGSNLSKRLVNRGEVLAIARGPLPLTHSQLGVLPADITSTIPDVNRFRGATVIHSAAVMNSPDRRMLWTTNVVGTLNMLEWAIRHEARHFVFFSSGGVYGYAKDRPWLESDPVNPIGFYGHTKLIAENLTRAYCDMAKLAVSVIRLFFPYGEGQKRGIFRLVSDSIQNGSALTVNQGGAPRINPVHIDDVVSATEKILDTPGGYHVFNLCGDEAVSFLDLVNRFESKHGKKAVLKLSGIDHEDLLGSNRLLKDQTGWQPRQGIAA
jgi:nucleoside-diphosphate-sugar epimerase